MKNILIFLTLPLWMLFVGLGAVVASIAIAVAFTLAAAFAVASMIVVWPFASWVLAKEVMQ